MDRFNPSISIGPVSLAYSDIATVFKIIAEVFSDRDPDKGLIQTNVILENEISSDHIWTSLDFHVSFLS